MIGKLMDIDGDPVVPEKIENVGCVIDYFQIYNGTKTWSKLFTRMVCSRKDHLNSVVIQYSSRTYIQVQERREVNLSNIPGL
jgi:hypothetical protein